MTSLDPIFLFVLALGAAGVWGTQSCLDDLADCRKRMAKDQGETCKRLGNMIKCVSESRCQREETNGVTFPLVEKIATDSCPAFSPLIRGPGEGCNDFTKCLAKDATNKYLILIAGGKHIENILKTGFWCSLFEMMMTCAITNADKCKLDASGINAIRKQRRSARNVCQGDVDASQACLKDLMDCGAWKTGDEGQTCTFLEHQILCVSESGCQLEESNGVTFQQVKDVSSESCPVFSPLMLGAGDYCKAFVTCLMKESKSKFNTMQVWGMYANDTVKTSFWCSLFEQIMTCAITNADECKLEASRIRDLKQQRENARNVCPGTGGAGTMQQGTLTTALVVWTAALILPLIFA